MRDPRRQLAAALALAVGAVLIFFATLFSAPVFGGEDSPWPETNQNQPNLLAVQAVVGELEAEITLMEWSAARYADWEECLHGVPVTLYGDPDNQFGYAYDERDGTGPSFMPALDIDRTSKPRLEDYLLIDFERGGECHSNPTKPGGTAEEASVRPPRHRPPPLPRGSTLPAPKSAHPLIQESTLRHPRSTHRFVHERRSAPRVHWWLVQRTTLGGRVRLSTLRDLEGRVREVRRAAERLDTSSERFDEWESCVSWIPVTQYGDEAGKFGYLFGGTPMAPEYMPALSIDRSEWEDPDYMFLALVGGDRPGRTCQDEPGEYID
jgi:hypothetical protein